MDENTISLTPPTIHVGSIVSPGLNETISIVIPLSAQLATIARKNITDVNDSPQQKIAPKSRRDNVQGCPYPTCSRYGHAFSRAHDLKRHIARHESRKEKLSDIGQTQLHPCPKCSETFVTDDGLLVHIQTHLKKNPQQIAKTTPTIFSCQVCKKKYSNANKLKVHLLAHQKKPEKSCCALCGNTYESSEDFENHMKEHTTSILQAQEALENSSIKDGITEDDDDNFLLEEMLLFKKDSRHFIERLPENATGMKKSASIRCNYCFKTFKTKWTLNCHVAAHEGRFQFDCRKCGKKFVRKSHYEGHVRSHEPARPYSCDQCGKSFKELKHRREHTKRKHPNAIQDAVQALLNNIQTAEEKPDDEQAKLTILMPMNFNV